MQGYRCNSLYYSDIQHRYKGISIIILAVTITVILVMTLLNFIMIMMILTNIFRYLQLALNLQHEGQGL